jgi:DNA mismatch repair protein MutL
LYIFDQHTVVERVRREAYLSQIKTQSLNLQQLFIPETFDISPSRVAALKVNITLFNELEIIVEEFSYNSFRSTVYHAATILLLVPMADLQLIEF